VDGGGGVGGAVRGQRKWGVVALVVPVVLALAGMRFARWRWMGERVDRVVVAEREFVLERACFLGDCGARIVGPGASREFTGVDRYPVRLVAEEVAGGLALGVCDRYGEAAVTLFDFRAGRFVEWGGGE